MNIEFFLLGCFTFGLTLLIIDYAGETYDCCIEPAWHSYQLDQWVQHNCKIIHDSPKTYHCGTTGGMP